MNQRSLAGTLLRAWQLRFVIIALSVAIAGIVIVSGSSDALTRTPVQRADAVMGDADAYLQLSSVPIGVREGLSIAVSEAVAAAGGVRPTVDYMTAGIRADGDDETTYGFEEFADPESMAPRLSLRDGRWPGGPNDVAVSEAIADRWPIGSRVSFFNGALDATVVGTFTNRFDHSSRMLVLAPGTWSSIDPSAGALIDPASLNVRWYGDAPIDGIRSAALSAIAGEVSEEEFIELERIAEVQTRPAIEAMAPTPNVTLTVARSAVPLAAGLVAGVIAGSFTARIRSTMWTIGVPRAQTRGAAYLAMLIASLIGVAIGAMAGVAGAFAIRPLLAMLANTDLGAMPDATILVTVTPLAIAGGMLGMVLAHRRTPRGARTPSRSFDRILWTATGATVLVAGGLFIGTGSTEVSKITLAGLLVSAGIVVISVPFLFAILRRVTDRRSPAVKLALRKMVAAGNAVGVTVIALLLVLGCAFAIFVTSIVTDINAATESQVAPAQIVFQPEVEDSASLRYELEAALGLTDPVVQSLLAAGNERGDGGTYALASASDLERILQVGLTSAQRSTLESGGMLVTKPLSGATSVTFPSDGERADATFPAAELTGIDPSFRNFSGYMLVTSAEAAGIPRATQSYVYVDVSPQQQAEAKSTAQRLDIRPDWVSVYKAPDELAAPLAVVSVAVGVSLAAAAVLFILTLSQVRSLRPDLAGLRAVGVPDAFLKRVVFIRVMLTSLLSMAVAVAASAMGVGVAFLVAGQSYGVTVPLVPLLSLVACFGAFGVAVAALSTRRINAFEWAEAPAGN